MRGNLEVTILQETGLPCVRVERDAIWALVEYLSYQRARVTYTYDQTHFNVCFLSMTREAAQQLVDDWLAPKPFDGEMPGHGEEQFSRALVGADSGWLD